MKLKLTLEPIGPNDPSASSMLTLIFILKNREFKLAVPMGWWFDSRSGKTIFSKINEYSTARQEKTLKVDVC